MFVFNNAIAFGIVCLFVFAVVLPLDKLGLPFTNWNSMKPRDLTVSETASVLFSIQKKQNIL